MLSSFDIYTIEHDADFNELVLFCAETFGASSEGAEIIFEKLTQREKIATQVIAELSCVLLHTRTNAVEHPVFAVIRPEGGVFTDAYFKGAAVCALLLFPQEGGGALQSLAGNISAALPESGAFLQALKTSGKQAVLSMLEAEVSDFLRDFCLRQLK